MEKLERLRKERSPIKASFTKVANELKGMLESENIKIEEVRVHRQRMVDKYDRLDVVQQQILELILEAPNLDIDYDKEWEAGESYRDKYLEIRVKADQAMELSLKPEVKNTACASSGASAYKLPKLEFFKFDGDLRNWLSFWGQFKQVHEDSHVPAENKFQYLIQCMAPGSKAARLVASYPPSAENYPKVIDQLRNRFGREDLLVQVYVRELVAMIMENAIKGRVHKELGTLYDSLESQLRALESLGRTKDKFTDFLCPLVESCLPEDILRLWERKLNHKENNELEEVKESSLEQLMAFLKQEVNSEERFSLAKNCFNDKLNSLNGNKVRQKSMVNDKRLETVNALVDSKKETLFRSRRNQLCCLFCAKAHESTTCYAARAMSMEERKKKVSEKRACFICLKPGHSADYCRTNNRCLVCNRKHAVILCPDVRLAVPNRKEVKDQPSTSSACLTNQTLFKQVLLSTILVRLDSEGHSMLVRCLLDSGSQKSYISETIVNQMMLPLLRRETMVHALFGGFETRPQKHNVYRVYLSGLDDSYSCNFEVLSQPIICGMIDKLNCEEQEIIRRIYGVNLPEDPSAPRDVQILIGADVLGKLYTGEVKPVGGDLVAVGTKLGWTTMGKLDRKRYLQEDSCMNVLTLLSTEETISNLWRMEVVGISDPLQEKSEQLLLSEKLQDFMETIEVTEEGRYRVRLPWRSDHPPLGSNRGVAWRRTWITRERLEKQKLLSDYRKVFEEWLKNDIIEHAPVDVSPHCHYLPHRPVIKEGSTTRVRPVFDASSHQKGSPSLNDCLEKGPKLIEEIPDILERFRSKRIGVTADIEKAFLQLEVHPDERDVLRFFGMDGREYRHRRVVFGVTSSPFLLGAILRHHLDKMKGEFEKTVEMLNKAFYVDNCVCSLDSEDEMMQFIAESKKIMEKGRFNLRGWESNSLNISTAKEVNVLGLVWNLGRDVLRCHLPDVHVNNVTKRSILSGAQRVFDPIGFLSPVTLYPKIWLQELWSNKLGWDEPVPEDCRLKFVKWKDQLELLKEVEIQRHSNVTDTSQLHAFADASKRAYAACLFLRTTNETGEVSVRLLRAKSRVAPLEKLTIPRLELMACLIAVRLVRSVKQALTNASLKTRYWSDSSNALTWITKEGGRTIFVRNRVEEIRKFSKIDEWKYVPGEVNPADLPSRGCSARKFLKETWWEGPKWLSLNEEEWPNTEFLCQTGEEVKTDMNLTVTTLGSEDIDYFKYFSNYEQIIRMVAWLRRFIHNSRRENEKRGGILTTEEILGAEKVLFRKIQSTNIIGHRRSSSARIFEDGEGLLRVETRITEREDAVDFLYPIVLPGDHVLVIRLIEGEHRRACHAGPQLLFGILREKYWIVGAKKAIRRVVRDCVRCKRYMQKAISPDPAVLPKDRVKDSAVFEVTGIDLAGPLYAKEGKIWIVLFTCAVYRAVHLELTSSLSTTAFLQALRRFIARRGRPGTIYTDNGTNFRGAENDFKKLDWDTIVQTRDFGRILWKFNPPTAAWWGGWWERLIRVTKDLLKRTLSRASLSYEELLTVVCECERVINSRPLTYYSGDADELVPLAPSLFLHDIKGEEVGDLDLVEGTHLTKRVRYRQRLMKELRQRFRKEYLGLLMKNKRQDKQEHIVKVGDVVLIGDDQQKRLKWPMGVVVQIHPGKDKVIRCVSVRTQTGVLVRPVQRIYPLEVTSAIDVSPAMEEHVEEHEEDAEPFVEVVRKRTRTGRLVKHPTRLDLFNQAAFCLFDQIQIKVGEC